MRSVLGVLLLLVLAGLGGCTSKPAGTDAGASEPHRRTSGQARTSMGENLDGTCPEANQYEQAAPEPVQIQDSGNALGPLPRKTWSWTIKNESFQSFNVRLILDGVGGVPNWSAINYEFVLRGGSCGPQTRAHRSVTFSTGGGSMPAIEYDGTGPGELGDWSLSIAAAQAAFWYDVQVSVVY